MNYYGVGIDNETAIALAHAYETKVLLCKTQDYGYNKAYDGSAKNDKHAFKDKDTANLSVG